MTDTGACVIAAVLVAAIWHGPTWAWILLVVLAVALALRGRPV